MKKVLVVSPHPDDAELGMGGIIHRKVQNGELVHIAICTGNGDLIMRHSNKRISFDVRRREQNNACRVLGVEAIFLDIAPASRFDVIGIVDFVTAFDRLFTKYDEVYIPMPSYAEDHNIVWRASLATLRCGVFTGCMYAYEQYLQSNTPTLDGVVMGRRYIQIMEDDLLAKLQSIAEYDSQMNGRYDPDLIMNAVKFRGKEVGVPLAEMVYTIREVY